MNRLFGPRNGQPGAAGGTEAALSTDGVNGHSARPSVNGSNGQHGRSAPPSANGDNGDSRPESAPAATPGAGRDARGRFARGYAGGPGNPFARRVAELRRRLLSAVTEEQLDALADELIARAKKGDVAAAKVVLSYTIGRPAETVDPDTLDLKEWQLFQRTSVNLEELSTMVESLPSDLACDLVRAMLPFARQHWAELVTKELKLDKPAPRGKAKVGRKKEG